MFLNRQNTLKTIVLIIAIALIASFVLHDIIPHSHPHHLFGTGIQAAFHGEDKKWWSIIVLASLLLSFAITSRWRLENKLAGKSFLHRSSYFILDFSKIFNPLREALRRGILHPKLCD